MDEWELYCLTTDSVERSNLMDFRTGELLADASVSGMTREDLEVQTTWLKTELAQQESAMLQN
jgi:hypothetical protein